jgi:hypothetical protein
LATKPTEEKAITSTAAAAAIEPNTGLRRRTGRRPARIAATAVSVSTNSLNGSASISWRHPASIRVNSSWSSLGL